LSGFPGIGGRGEMKRSIEWHKKCLGNHTAAMFRKFYELQKLRAEHDKMVAENIFCSDQIAEAVKQGKDGFDRHRFMKGRKKI